MDKTKKLHHIHPEDVVQLVFGALIFGIPAAYSQETWDLGAQLHFANYLFLFLLSILLIALIVSTLATTRIISKHWNMYT